MANQIRTLFLSLKPVRIVGVAAALLATGPAPLLGADGSDPLLFCYFTGKSEDGLHLASSEDGLKWTALKGGRSFLKPEVGESKLMRDPCILMGPDCIFRMVWTSSWTGKTIGYASSTDLIHWSPQKAIPVMADEPDVKNCWAPEVVFDDKKKEYVIFWASTIPGKFPKTAGPTAKDGNHRIYATTTKDFEIFTPTHLFYDPGFVVIDATFLKAEDHLYLIVKDETENPPKKNLRIADAAGYQGPFTELSAPFSPDWIEGPTAIRIGADYVVYFDAYRAHHYGAMKSHDLKTWEDITGKLTMPSGMRHGTAFRVPRLTLEKLRQEK